MTSLFTDTMTVEQFDINWLLPKSLQQDSDLNDEVTSKKEEAFYSDNLVAQVVFNEHEFNITKRFLICKNLVDLNIFQEEGWDWDEHGDLSPNDQDLVEFIIKKCPELFIPSDAFQEQLRAFIE